jgi:diguanylate cyclase (GGDEF)-like protein
MNDSNESTPPPPTPPPKRPRTIRISREDFAKAQEALRREAWLTVIRGGQDLGAHVRVQGVATIGRDPESTLPLRDLNVSWQHARVTAVGDGTYRVEDVGSTNGTRLGTQVLTAEHPLQDGDKILMGGSVVRFALADPLDVDFQKEVDLLVGTDPLTGLESKRRYDDALDYALEVARQEDRPLALLMMDMDGVKQINDTHGHLFGAYVIGQTGRLFPALIGPDGRACRFGGDEFSAFLPGRDKASAVAAAESIRHAVETAAFEKDGIPLRPTMSLGVAAFPEDGRTVLDLVAAADAALYRAKGQGKNRVCT